MIRIKSWSSLGCVWFTSISRDAKGNTKEAFSVTVENKAGGDSYTGNSSGERRKADLAIAMAMSDLTACRSNGIDLWVGDEICESLERRRERRGHALRAQHRAEAPAAGLQSFGSGRVEQFLDH